MLPAQHFVGFFPTNDGILTINVKYLLIHFWGLQHVHRHLIWHKFLQLMLQILPDICNITEGPISN